ncbi:MAG: hypothetical protein MJE63_28875 [Proteobacteria bacterium]|nr:hypothetical protein [Pseudomonadota bacterium]
MFWKIILSKFVKNRLTSSEPDFEQLAEDLSLDYFKSFLGDCASCPAVGLSANECKDYE